jgi:hypothetical protein
LSNILLMEICSLQIASVAPPLQMCAVHKKAPEYSSHEFISLRI